MKKATRTFNNPLADRIKAKKAQDEKAKKANDFQARAQAFGQTTATKALVNAKTSDPTKSKRSMNPLLNKVTSAEKSKRLLDYKMNKLKGSGSQAAGKLKSKLLTAKKSKAVHACGTPAQQAVKKGPAKTQPTEATKQVESKTSDATTTTETSEIPTASEGARQAAPSMHELQPMEVHIAELATESVAKVETKGSKVAISEGAPELSQPSVLGGEETAKEPIEPEREPKERDTSSKSATSGESNEAARGESKEAARGESKEAARGESKEVTSGELKDRACEPNDPSPVSPDSELPKSLATDATDEPPQEPTPSRPMMKRRPTLPYDVPLEQLIKAEEEEQGNPGLASPSNQVDVKAVIDKWNERIKEHHKPPLPPTTINH